MDNSHSMDLTTDLCREIRLASKICGFTVPIKQSQIIKIQVKSNKPRRSTFAVCCFFDITFEKRCGVPLLVESIWTNGFCICWGRGALTGKKIDTPTPFSYFFIRPALRLAFYAYFCFVGQTHASRLHLKWKSRKCLSHCIHSI